MGWILVILLLALVTWGIVSFNLLVRDRHRVAQAWSDVGVQLTRRHDLVPKLVEVVKRHAAYEGGLLVRVTELRSLGMREQSPAMLGRIEDELAAGLNRLLVLVESYPELKASEGFLELQRELSEIENQIQYSRRYYNGAVNNLNTRIDSIPDAIVARIFAFRPAEYFEADRQAAIGAAKTP
jgi:LemA protein